MTTLAVFGVLWPATVIVAGLVVAYLRYQIRLDELEIKMLKSQVAELSKHPAVRPRPRPEVVKHRDLVAVSDAANADFARAAANHAEARARREEQ